MTASRTWRSHHSLISRTLHDDGKDSMRGEVGNVRMVIGGKSESGEEERGCRFISMFSLLRLTRVRDVIQ